MKKILYTLLAVSFIFTSCEKCKDCELKYEFINDDDVQGLYEFAAALGGYNSFNEMWNADDSIQSLNKEYCDDGLSEIKNYTEEHDTDSNQVNDIRFYYDCK